LEPYRNKDASPGFTQQGSDVYVGALVRDRPRIGRRRAALIQNFPLLVHHVDDKAVMVGY